MPVVNIPFGPFLPSQPDFKNPGCVVANNVRPGPGNSYRHIPAPEEQSAALTGVFRSAQQFRFPRSNLPFIVAGSENTLNMQSALRDTEADITLPSAYGLPVGEFWDFTQFNDIILAIGRGSGGIYFIDVRDNRLEWMLHDDNSPQASRIARVGDFVMAGNFDDESSRIAWSGLNDPLGDWEASRRTQAGNATLNPRFGRIQRIVGGRYALIFQDTGISRLSYIGPPVVWNVSPVSEGRGTSSALSVVDIGYLTYFLARDGFFVTNGSQFIPIGNERVNRWFFDTVDANSIETVQGTVDWQNSSVIWAFKADGGAPHNDRLIIYSWLYDNWTTATIDTLAITSFVNPATSFDDDDFPYATVEDIPFSPDSSVWRPSNDVFSAYRPPADGTADRSALNIFNGPPMEAVFETGEFEISPGQRVFIDEIYPVVEQQPYDAYCSVITQDNFGVEIRSEEMQVGFDGFSSVLAEGQTVRIRVRQPENATPWGKAQGIRIRFRQAGVR